MCRIHGAAAVFNTQEACEGDVEGGQSLVREASLSPEPQAMAVLLSGESLGVSSWDVVVAMGDSIPSRWTDDQ